MTTKENGGHKPYSVSYILLGCSQYHRQQ